MRKLKFRMLNRLTQKVSDFRASTIKIHQTESDPDDNKTFHLVLETSEEIVGYLRLAFPPFSYLAKSTFPPVKFPNENQGVEIGRLMIKDKFRGLGLSYIILLEALKYAKRYGFKYFFGVADPNYFYLTKYLDIGVSKHGQLVAFSPIYLDKSHRFTQPIIFEFTNIEPKLEERLDSTLIFLKQAGYFIYP
ncbi:MAG: GNAT family N-acetyltransferase [Bacteroidia bacterium]